MEIEELKKIQQECAKKVIQRDDFEKLITVGGIDLTFEDIKSNPTKAWASIVIVDINTLKPVYEDVVEGLVDFPYIPTFLAFRELPLMLELYQKIKIKPDVYFIDGQGVAHPRGCGIASHFGVATNSVSIGVAKTKLFGYYKEPEEKRGSYSYLTYKGSIVGAVLRTKDRTEPVYVSVGHRISLKKAIELVLRTSIYRIPEPTRLAHNLLQKVRKRLY
ncbi:MAG: endonuclease V [Hydrogenobacter thermophilus]|uniref:Endonuclease V n=1 Tax=Hydrogenobacter thermophilus (strain DSM 6534 / IAM 12695 / TK-6) TaxID=608538 RepID=D3DHC2_HYDTT|nr:endonuclease V [Hydrogenobacter thermophilus]ADO45162.1 Deoxyribonuclease V [Hydrogenobacter thermophilus TK-6]MCS7284238.1 endonuclease V [Hydrogenobacter thermophilus]BAI69224.1 deoxyribonuclease V [Hydrogenobacter thermophilus TK-6]